MEINEPSLLSSDLRDYLLSWTTTDQGRKILSNLKNKYIFSKGKPVPMDIPLQITEKFANDLAELCQRHHRLVETIISEYPNEPLLKQVITIPHSLTRDISHYQKTFQDRVDFCRLDFYFDNNLYPHILETNANCPGLLLYSGMAASIWRHIINKPLPSPLEYENLSWFAEWYINIAKKEFGKVPTEIALFRQEGGHRLELDAISRSFQLFKIPTFECDPRELSIDTKKYIKYRNRRIEFGYSKISIPELTEMRTHVEPLFQALREGKIYIPNGINGRLIGDNKLCLAVISDERFSGLFDTADLQYVSPHIPWSRNIAYCNDNELTCILNEKDKYVLKRPLDTRGRGVIVGKEVHDALAWEKSVVNALEHKWLVMQYIEPTRINLYGEEERHDLAIGLVKGKIAGAFLRSSSGYRVNVAQAGTVHPLFWGGGNQIAP